jgi:hypothetical protein
MIKNNLFGLVILIIFITTSANVFANNSVLNKYNVQTSSSIQLNNGKAFGEKTSRQILNNLSEIPLNKTSSIGEISQFSRVESSYKNYTRGYSFNGIEFFYRTRILATKFANITLHNSYKFHGIYNENKYLQQMPKQNDYEIKLLIAHNMTDRLINNLINPVNQYFARLEIGYRHKFNNPFDEIRERFYLGFRLNDKFSFLTQHDLVFAITRNTSPTRNSRRQLQDFDFSKNFHHIISPNIIYKLNNQSALQIGYLHRFGGNDGQFDSRGFLIGYLKSF